MFRRIRRVSNQEVCIGLRCQLGIKVVIMHTIGCASSLGKRSGMEGEIWQLQRPVPSRGGLGIVIKGGQLVREGGVTRHCTFQQVARCSWFIPPTLTVLLSKRAPHRIQGSSSVWKEVEFPCTETSVRLSCQALTRHSSYFVTQPPTPAPDQQGWCPFRPPLTFAPGSRGLWSTLYLPCFLFISVKLPCSCGMWGLICLYPTPHDCSIALLLLGIYMGVQISSGSRGPTNPSFAF